MAMKGAFNQMKKTLSEKGYFKGIDPFTKVHDIIDNCEVREYENC